MHLRILSHSHNDDCILWRQTAFWGTSLYIITVETFLAVLAVVHHHPAGLLRVVGGATRAAIDEPPGCRHALGEETCGVHLVKGLELVGLTDAAILADRTGRILLEVCFLGL
jgi:hypothetical protein